MASFIRIVVQTALLFMLAACGASTPEPANITIEMNEYTFTPENIQLQVGQQVTFALVILNELDHELMIGRLVTRNEDGQPSRFSTNFFTQAGVLPEVSGGAMLVDHEENEMESEEGSEEMEDMEGREALEEIHFAMIMQPAGAGNTTVTFAVTGDVIGTWEMGCFEDQGVHYTSGMTGEITVSR